MRNATCAIVADRNNNNNNNAYAIAIPAIIAIFVPVVGWTIFGPHGRTAKIPVGVLLFLFARHVI